MQHRLFIAMLWTFVIMHHVPQTVLLWTFFFSSSLWNFFSSSYELFFSSPTRVPQENEGSTGTGPTSSVSVNSLIAKWIYCWSVTVIQYWLIWHHLWQAILNWHQELPMWPQILSILLQTYIYIYTYTGCPGRNVPDFRGMFLKLKYTNITQNTYIQSWTVTEIMAREVWKYGSCYTLIDYQIHIKTGRNMWFL